MTDKNGFLWWTGVLLASPAVAGWKFLEPSWNQPRFLCLSEAHVFVVLMLLCNKSYFAVSSRDKCTVLPVENDRSSSLGRTDLVGASTSRKEWGMSGW